MTFIFHRGVLSIAVACKDNKPQQAAALFKIPKNSERVTEIGEEITMSKTLKMSKTLQLTAWSGAVVIAVLSLAGCGGSGPGPEEAGKTDPHTQAKMEQMYKQRAQTGQQTPPAAPK